MPMYYTTTTSTSQTYTIRWPPEYGAYVFEDEMCGESEELDSFLDEFARGGGGGHE